MPNAFGTEAAVSDGKPRLGEQLSYVAGEFASNFAWNMVAGYLLFYYTDIALLPVAALGTLMLVTRLLDAVFDPLVGIVVDRTRSRWGKARPYLLLASVPFGILCVLTFAVPAWSATAKVLYAYLTFTLLGLCYSLVYIPFGALQPMMVRDEAIKQRIGSWRAMSTSVASIIVYSAVLPLAAVTGPQNRAGGFTLAAAVVSAITVALYLLVFRNCRERFTETPAKTHAPFLKDIGRLFRNPVWLLSFLYAMISFVRIGVVVSVTAYFANTVLHQPGLMAIILPLLSVAILTGGFIASLTLTRFGMKRVNLLALGLSVLIMLAMPYLESSTTALLAAFALANVSGGIIGATVFITVANSVEYNERRFGDRNEGLLFAGVSFGMKAGIAIGAAATAFLLAWAGYDPKSAGTAHGTIRALFYYVPAALTFMQALFLLYFPVGAKSVHAD